MTSTPSWRVYRRQDVDGILVAMPHKFTAFALCATSSERTKMLGVVSVIRRNPDRTWHGDMLDGLAFVKAQKDHGAQPEGARVLLVGAGGAGSAIAIALLEARVGEHITTPRTPNAELAHHVGGRNFTPTTVRPCQSAFRQWPSCSLKASGTNVAERLLRSQADPLRDLFARPLAMASARPGARASPFAAVPDAGSQC